MKLRAFENKPNIYIDLNNMLIFEDMDNRIVAIEHLYNDIIANFYQK